MVSSSAELAIHWASFRDFRNLTYRSESSVSKSKSMGPHYSQVSLGQVIEGQVRRGIGSGGWRVLGSHP